MCFIYIYFLLLCSTLCQNRIEKFTEQPNQTSQAKKEHKKIYIENKNNNYAVYLTYINIVFFLLLFVLFLLLFGTFPNIQGVPDGRKLKINYEVFGISIQPGIPCIYVYTNTQYLEMFYVCCSRRQLSRYFFPKPFFRDKHVFYTFYILYCNYVLLL